MKKEYRRWSGDKWSATATIATCVVSGFAPNTVLHGVTREEVVAGVKEYKPAEMVPDEYLAWIGRVMKDWALAEWVPTGTLCYLLGIGRKEGRHLFQNDQERHENVIKKIRYMLKLKNIKLNSSNEKCPYKELSSLYNECAKQRNLLAHGIWVEDTDTKELGIQVISDNWDGLDVSRLMYPQIYLIKDTKWFEEIVDKIDCATRMAQNLNDQVEAALPR
jgi:hypothetical protein